MATNKRWDGSSFVDLTTKKRWDGASWVDLTIGKRWDGTTWVDCLSGGGSGLSATVSPGSVSGLVVDDATFVTVTSNSATVTATGGAGPYTYAWARVTGSSAVSATSPAAATTTFSATVPLWGMRLATMRCTITDSLSATVTVDVVVELFHNGTGSPP